MKHHFSSNRIYLKLLSKLIRTKYCWELQCSWYSLLTFRECKTDRYSFSGKHFFTSLMKIDFLCDLEMPTPSYLPERYENICSHSIFPTTALFKIAKTENQSKVLYSQSHVHSLYIFPRGRGTHQVFAIICTW